MKTDLNIDEKIQIESHEGLTLQIEETQRNVEIHRQKGDIDKLILSYKTLIDIFAQLENKLELGKINRELGIVFLQKGSLDISEQYLIDALAVYEDNQPDSPITGQIYYDLANLYQDKGELEDAIIYWHKALPLFQSNSMIYEEADTLNHLGFVYQDKSDEGKAIQFFNRALTLYQKIQKIDDEANVVYSIGLAYYTSGKIKEAITHFLTAIDLYSTTENPFDDADTYYSLCLAYNESGEDVKAKESYIKVLSKYVQNPASISKVANLREIGANIFSKDELNNIFKSHLDEFNLDQYSDDNLTRINAFFEISRIYKTMGDLDNALKFGLNALELSKLQEDGNKKYASINQNLGLICHQMHDYDNALGYYKEAAKFFKRIDQIIDLAYSFFGLGNVYLAQGKANRSKKYFLLGLDIYETRHDILGKASASLGLGNAYRLRGEPTKAIEMYLQALNLFEDSSNPTEEASTMYNLGEAYFGLGEYELALDKYERSLNLFEHSPNPASNARSLTGIANVYRGMGDPKKAVEYYEQALELLKESLNPEKMYPLNNLAEMYITQGNYELAKILAQESLELSVNSPNPLFQAIPLTKLASTYYKQGDMKRGYENASNAVEILSQSPNPQDIFQPLDLILEYHPERAFAFARISPLGCNWLLTKFHTKINQGDFIDTSLWFDMWQACVIWWDDVKNHIMNDSLSESEYINNWKINFLLEEAQRKVSTETFLNFLIGANDIESDIKCEYKNLRNPQVGLKPMWFVEFPSKLLHGERYLKIRLNNLININDDFQGVPDITQDEFSQVTRIKLQLETQWLQSLKVDHIFYPNSDEENQAFRINSEKTWLKDVIIMDLGNNVSKENTIELSVTGEFYSKDPNEPYIRTTTKIIKIPVIRTSNYQELKKFKELNANSLAVMLAVWSILFSIATLVIENIDFFSEIHINQQNILIIFALIFGIIGSSHLWLKKTKNQDVIGNKIQ
ncbi:MAG: tetratricopeptide repeat protein [Candidatus Heimdallarchaeota archaeon]|nr:tetratricopeptide repeat protein [Candidatus Heimdallarchaeota archaeon]